MSDQQHTLEHTQERILDTLLVIMLETQRILVTIQDSSQVTTLDSMQVLPLILATIQDSSQVTTLGTILVQETMQVTMPAPSVEHIRATSLAPQLLRPKKLYLR